MIRDRTLIILSVAGLSKGLLDSGGCPALDAFARKHRLIPVRPVLPALTLSMQATFMTGRDPGRHGIVGNGFFDRSRLEHVFWSPSANLLDAPPFWASRNDEGFRTAALFWWNCLAGGLDVYLNVSPIHRADGTTVSSCYSDPPGLYGDLEKKLGPFPLHRFWGPGISLESSKWILDATMHVTDELEPDVLLGYIPHMDYSLQRSGPGSDEAVKHLGELDGLLAPVLQQAEKGAFDLLLLSEYGISPVRHAVSPNRALLEERFFRIRSVKDLDYPDLPGSRAFALCDHQVAHIYIQEPEIIPEVAALISGLEGVNRVLDGEGKIREGLDHERSGDLVAVSEHDAWFEYSWWEDPVRAPEYARTVDIHRKIGYDPLELVYDIKSKQLASSTRLIKGSHGAIPETNDELPIIIIPFKGKDIDYPSPLPATQVKDVVRNLLAGGNIEG